jgi:protocatechuate 3,4-dioxygenase beta subunit
MLRPTPPLGRRSLAAGLLLALPPMRAGVAQPLVPTPRQTTGPFYPVDWTGDIDADLVRVVGEAARAQGTVAHLRGRVLDVSGAPVPGAAIEIWQCDAFGRYRHPRDRQEGRDPGFQGRGRTTAGADGAYAFRTIRPVPYPGRTPHIHVAVVAPGREPLVTQLYVAGEPLNERDGLFNSVRDPRRRAALLARFEPADRIEPGALLAGFDIVLA